MMTATRKDTHKAWLTDGASYEGKYEFPHVTTTCRSLPLGLIPFEKRNKGNAFNQWIHFYLDDWRFECVWRNPTRYVDSFRSFAGIITPDYSLYRDFPLCEQIHNVYRNRALGYWFGKQGIPIIPNVRWGNKETYEFCFDGIDKNSIVAIGTHGCIQGNENRHFFVDGLERMVQVLSPHTIIVYGAVPEDIFAPVKKQGIQLLPFASYTVQTRERRAA